MSTVTRPEASGPTWTDETLLAATQKFATQAHTGHQRSYTFEPYVKHPIAVARIVKRFGGSVCAQAAAFLHDTMEDCGVTEDDLRAECYPEPVIAMTVYMTEVSVEGNRKTRKHAECVRLSKGGPEEQTIKLADLFHNALSIVRYDPKFAKGAFLPEMRRLVEALDKADPNLRSVCFRFLERHESALGIEPSPTTGETR